MDFTSELAAERELVHHATQQLDAQQSSAGLNLAVATGDLERGALERMEAKRRRRQRGGPWLHGRLELADEAMYYVGDFKLALGEGVEAAGNPSRLWDLFHEAFTDEPR